MFSFAQIHLSCTHEIVLFTRKKENWCFHFLLDFLILNSSIFMLLSVGLVGWSSAKLDSPLSDCMYIGGY